MPLSALELMRSEVPLRDLSPDELQCLSADMKLSLDGDDMWAVQAHFRELARDPTDVELEVIAQTWSEHCKHRIFNASIEHTRDGATETVDGLFNTFVKKVTDEIKQKKPDFVLSAFDDNAGFIRIDKQYAVCLKAETHNHPTAIEPYAGANTGLGGVIRDILGAGKGAEPIASLDVFCFGHPDTPPEALAGDIIHPLGIFRGVVRGVRDYGNRMGIPTVTGAIHFDDGYLYNPLVFCGTAGVLPVSDIAKSVEPGMKIVLVGGRTGHDGLRGATFSSASLDTGSHEEDQGAVQIGNPIEEKKVADFIIVARKEGLIGYLTDCGAGGLSSAVGEMVSGPGGEVFLECVPLKKPDLFSWEVFLSESQERMVLGVEPGNWDRLVNLAAVYETECSVIGKVTGDGVLRVFHHGEMVCELDCSFLHSAPRKAMLSAYHRPALSPFSSVSLSDESRLGKEIRLLLLNPNVTSREPVIREYDHEVKGNTVTKPLAGATGDCPQDGAVLRVGAIGKYIALGVSMLPQYGLLDPYRMGLSSVDEAIRQLVVTGANPHRIAILDNFCMGNPHEPKQLGRLVECARGMASAASSFETPFISGKDSFYNYFETEGGPVSIPVTLLVSAVGIVEDSAHITGASLRRPGNAICLLGYTHPETGGSAYVRMKGDDSGVVPDLNTPEAQKLYTKFHEAVKKDWIASAHDLSEGGLAVTLCESAFSLQAGVEVDLQKVPVKGKVEAAELLFSESNSRILFETAPEDVEKLRVHFAGMPFAQIGETVAAHRSLRLNYNQKRLVDEDLSELKKLWQNGLTPYY